MPANVDSSKSPVPPRAVSPPAGSAGFVDETRVQIERRIAALEPLIVEYRILRITLAAIDCWMPRPDAEPRTRAQQVLEAIAWTPGATPAEIASYAGIGVTKVYPALRILETQGFAHRSDRRWYLGPAGSTIPALVAGPGADGPPEG
jgi:hypothetical protein